MDCCIGSEAMPDIKPLHPAILANALEGNIHKEVGRSRAAKSTKIRKNMMLKNLLKTWEKLAPDEVDIERGYFRLRRMNPVYCFYWESFLTEMSASFLQCYIQRCIQDRGWVSSLRIFPDGHATGRVWVDDEDETDYTKSLKVPVNALLTAYLTALAAQRPITTEYWQHFKPETPVCEFTCIAHWGGIESDPYPSMSHLGYFTLEENPSMKVRLAEVITSVKTGYCIYIADQDYGDRVFYHYGGDQFWARLVENFLGLVDAKHPEHEGLLRFVEVAN
jgi:hypothetical protein